MTFIPEKNYKLTPGNEQLFVERNTVIASEINVGDVISNFRETTITSSTGIVSASNSGIILGTGTSANSTARFQTKRRGEYVAGFSAEVGVGVIVPSMPTGEQYARWGYYDDFNGVGCGVDSTGSFFFKRVDSVDEMVYQDNWSLDTLDGSGSSGLVLDLSQGVISEINFTWYGLGDIIASFRMFDSGSNMRREVAAHRQIVTGTLSFNNPNQPITCEVGNGSTDSDFNIIVGGRQFTLFGKTDVFERPVSTYVTGSAVTSTLPTTLATFKRKQVFGNAQGSANSTQVFIKNLEVFSDQPVLYEVVYGLSGSGFDPGDFVDIPTTAVSESVLSYQLTGSNWPGDTIMVNCGFVGGGNSPQSKIITLNQDSLATRLSLGDEDVIQIRIAKISSDATVSFAFDWTERW